MRHLSPRAVAPRGLVQRGLVQRGHVRRGLTLIELMLTITIAGFLLVAAAPHFSEYTNNSRLREGGTTLQTEAMFAQSEAIKRNRVVRLTISGSTIQVLEAQDTAAMTLLRERTLAGGVAAAAATVDFAPRGFPVNRAVTPPVDFVAASIDLGMPGVTCSAEQRCPGLRIDAGGGIRLCGNKLSGC
ncbi:MAG: GspH/FimT family pseudopilin [Rubrivivax sp.]|nr:GspH/FimT family pseudopilin [Rubrivivax sp.]